LVCGPLVCDMYCCPLPACAVRRGFLSTRGTGT
jgi:hypothetical protein